MIKIKLTGWNAVIVILLFVGFFVVQNYRLHQKLDAQGTMVVKKYLANKYLNNISPILAKKQSTQDSERTAKEIEKVIEQSKTIEIQSMSAKRRGDGFIVRVEYTVQGNAPTDGQSPRYLRLKSSLGTFWVEHEVPAWTYYSLF
jgi:hypothetical protein